MWTEYPLPVAYTPRSLEFEARVKRQVHRFELKALVDLLVSHGYRREQILFQGNPDGGKGPIVEDIEFPKIRKGRVVITVNIGLLGDNSLLPSYFIQEIERSRQPDRFYDFIRFFDHRLIDNFLQAVWSEGDEQVSGDYELMRRSLLAMTGFTSVSSMWWLVQSIFPELDVQVARGAFADTTSSHACRTGSSLLDGTNVIGNFYESDAEGFVVDLVAEEETDARGRSWATLLGARIKDRFLPVLAPSRTALIIRLHVRTHESWAHIEPSHYSANGYLGYDRIAGDPESGHTVVLFRGTAGVTSGDPCF